MFLCGHVGIAAVIIPSCTSAHRHGENISADMPSSRHTIQWTNFYTFQQMKYYHYWNTYKYALNYFFYTCFKTRVSKGKTLLLQ